MTLFATNQRTHQTPIANLACRVEADMRAEAQAQQGAKAGPAAAGKLQQYKHRGPGYLVEATGAFVGINEAKARLMLFCDKLPADRYCPQAFKTCLAGCLTLGIRVMTTCSFEVGLAAVCSGMVTKHAAHSLKRCD